MAGLGFNGRAAAPGTQREDAPLLRAERGEGSNFSNQQSFSDSGSLYPPTPQTMSYPGASSSYSPLPQNANGYSPLPQGLPQGRREEPARPAPTGGIDSNAQLDVVQFSNMFFYVNEGDGKANVSAMRIGNLQTPCSVQFHTEDNSAKAGHKYKKTEGKIDFLPGEEMKSVEIKIIQDDSFDTNLDFSVVLGAAVGCQLDGFLQSCRVVIIDDDVFPDNKYAERIAKDDNLDGIGVQLLTKFIFFAIERIPMVRFRTICNFAMDQVFNLAYLWSIYLNVYMVDVVFAVHDETSNDKLWIKNQRFWTVVLCAFGVIIPKALLNYIEFQEDNDLAVGGKVKLHLRVNLFRKYLYYNQTSHSKVSAQELTKAMQDDINELVSYGFMVIFKIAQQSVKVGVILYFLVKKRPSTALPLIVYPIAMALVLNLRYEKTLLYKDELRDAQKRTMQTLRESCDDINLIKEYNMRTAVVNRYEATLRAEGPAGDDYGIYDFNTMLIMPWITNVSIMIFMILGGHFVLHGELSLGAYLATIGIYKDAGDLFSGFYGHLKDCYGVIGPLLRIVRLLNMETDVTGAMEQAHERTQGMISELKADENLRKQGKSQTPRGVSRFDMLHLKLVHASLANDRGGPLFPCLQDISVEVPQGKLVAILGPHGSGKFSLLKLLTGLVKPRNGKILVPTHLRCICVGNKPEIFKNGNLLENLTFGTKDEYDKARLVKLCDAVGLGQHTKKIMAQDIKEKGNADSDEAKQRKEKGIPWHDELSSSEKQKMSITRALNLNPEVMLLHRPVDEMEADHAARILDVFRRQVDEKGIFNTPEQKTIARPHTVFFTTGEDRERAESAADVADVVWHTHPEKGFRVAPGGRAGTGMSSMNGGGGKGENKIISSWSKECRNLQGEVDKQKHLHQASLEEMEQQRYEIEHLKSEADYVRGTLNDVTSQAKRALRDARTYESDLHSYEVKQAETSSFWTACVERQSPPNPKTIARSLTDIISAGEGGQNRKKGTSPGPAQNGSRPPF